MKLSKRFFILLIFIIFSYHAKTQLLPLKIYYTEDGLASSQVWSIIEDKHGYIWFGCSSGISKFNGFKFVTYRLKEGLPSESINKIVASQSGIVVAETVKGLAYIKDFDKHFIKIPNIGEYSDIVIFDTLIGKKIVQINPLLYAAVVNKGIYRFDFNTKKWEYLGFKELNPTALQFSGTKIVFSAANGDIYMIENCKNKKIKLLGHTEKIKRIKKSKNHNIILISERAIYLLKDNKIKPILKTHGEEEIFFDAIIDSKNNLWVASNFGLRKVKGDINILYTNKNGIPGIRTLSTFESKEGILWFGTNHGVCKLISEDILVFRNPVKRSSSSYISFFYDRERETMMIGNTSGVFLVKNNKTEILNSAYLLKFPVWAITKDKKGNFYFATEGGGVVKRAKNGKETHFRAEDGFLPGNNVTDILLDNDTLYVSCKEGFAIYKNNKWKTYTISNGLPVSYIRCLEKYENEAILLGTLGKGVLIFKNGKFNSFLETTPEELKSVYALYYNTQNKTLWVATNYGLAKIHNGKLKLYTSQNGFLPFGLSAVFPAKNYLWVGSDGGAQLFDIQKEKVVKILTKDDGLPGNEFTTHNAIAKDDSNHIWFGFFGGAARLDNLGLSENEVHQFNPKIFLTKLKYFYQGKTVIKEFPNRKITLPYGAKEIFINFDVIWFRNEYSLNIEYKLEGINTNWNKIKDFKDMKVYFTSISPGIHPLMIRISSFLSNRQFKKTILEISVPKPWWQQSFYQALITFLVLFSILALVNIYSQYKTRKLKEEKEILNKLVAERTEELAKVNAELAEKNKRLNELANHDFLTGLYNRRFFMNQLEILKNITSREDIYIVCFIIFDIDNFKRINDTYGHKVGDEVLKSISAIIKKKLRRKSDIAARYGGEEFIIALLKSNKEAAKTIAETIRKEVEKTKIQIDNLSLSVTLSGGISCINIVSATLREINEAIDLADKNLYLAKNRGKNRIEG